MHKVVIIIATILCNWQLSINDSESVNILLTHGADIAIKTGDGKMRLNLDQESNNLEGIKELISSQTDRLPSHTCKPVEANPNHLSIFYSNTQTAATEKRIASTTLPPFSGKLKVDTELELSHDNIKQSIEEFYGNKQLSAIEQLKATPPFPTPHVLSQFAYMAYRDCKHGEPNPPDGWQLLTTASHFGIKNGYFGVAYWHPEHQQVVIAHRGTDITNVGALVTDLKGVVFNNYVEQMSSASTFANKVVAVLQQIEQEKKVSFELFFTGHSLGGWLAQITTFTTKYLEVKNGTFLKKLKTQQGEKHASSAVPDDQDVCLTQINPFTCKCTKDNAGKLLKKPIMELGEEYTSFTVQDSHDVTHSYHPHTVVFESPGCKSMLSQMADKLDVRLQGSSIDLQHLDITSYLSAPNLINTCNSHVGTVYRIFTDLSDMGFLQKHTPLYNLATHKMDKIVQAFDPETGQVLKDGKGRLKIQEVVDWPVSAGLQGDAELSGGTNINIRKYIYGAELEAFFRWSEHHNDYHPHILGSVHKKVPKGYHWLRYQTKAYDECTQSLSIFTEEEREFLERYRWLRHMQEFFKPADIFSVMNNAGATKEAEQKLQNFELDNESIRCPDASTLHELIPYVKRLLRLFPDIKLRVNTKLSSAQIRNRVYQHETQRYVENIRQSVLDFNPGALGLRDFLDSDQQIWQLRLIDGDAWTGLTEVYWVLKNTFCTPNYSTESHYTILELERLLTVNRMVNLIPLLSSMETPHLLIIVCGTKPPYNKDVRDIFDELFSILKHNNALKVILITQSDCDTTALLQQIAAETFGFRFITTNKQLTWSDLTASSQTAMLEKTVIFQGRVVTLSHLTSVESITDSLPLTDLLHGKEIAISEDPVPSASSGYNEKYYIERIFNHKIIIRQDIVNDKREEKFTDILVRTEQEFKQFCQQNPNSNVHWLVEDKLGELVWQQSKGNLNILRKYIDAHKSHSYAPSNLDNLLQQAKKQRVMIIADIAGMGKSTVLTHLSKRIKQKSPANWLVRIDLNDYTELLKAQKGEKLDKGRVFEFVSNEVLKLESHFEKQLFKKSFEGNEISKVVVMLDGFDEISPNYKDTVIDMLQILKQTSIEQLWVTSRPHLREELEDKLQQLSYNLEPFSELEQVQFLEKFWTENLNLGVTNQHRLQIYAVALISNLAQSISDKDKQFTGIPLQTRMVAEAFEQEFRSFYMSEQSQPELQHTLDLVGLYRRFIERKYDIYYQEKSRAQQGNVVIDGLRQSTSEPLRKKHVLLALQALFTEYEVKSLEIDYDYAFSDEDLARIGMVHINNDGTPQFIHRTFAEFFVAEFLIKELLKETKQNTNVQDFLVNEVLSGTDYHVIRSLLDALLQISAPSNEVLKELGEKLDHKWKEPRSLMEYPSALHRAAREDNVNIIGLLLDSLKSGEHSNTLREMLLAKDHNKKTAWHVAVQTNSPQALKKIWEWAEAVSSTLMFSLLVSQDGDSKTAWHMAAEGGHIQLLEKMWDWFKEANINAGELQTKLLLAQDSEGKTVWHVAAQWGRLQLIEKLWDLAKDKLKDAGLLKNKLLLSRDKHGVTAWHLAAMTGSVEILGKLWEWAKYLQLEPEELRNELLLLEDKTGQTAWHKAAESGHYKVLEKMWGWATDGKLNPDYLKSALFLSEHSSELSAWRIAVYNGHIYVLDKLWGWAEKLQLTKNELNKLLLAVDRDGNTAIYWASYMDNVDFLNKMWSVYKETQLNPDDFGKFLVTAWHRAAAGGYMDTLERLWLWAGEVQLNTYDFKRRLFIGQSKDGESVWHMAAAGGHIEVLEKLWDWAKKEKLNQDYLKSLLFLPEYSFGFSTWYYAIREVRADVIQKMWGWAVELKLTPDELKNNLFLAVDRDGNNAIYLTACTGSTRLLETMWGLSKKTNLNPDELSQLLVAAWHEAAARGYLEILQRLWLWAGDVQKNQHELNRRLLLEQNNDGQSAWHLAAAKGHIEVLDKLWHWATREQIDREQLKGKFAWLLAVKRVIVRLFDYLTCFSEEEPINTYDTRISMLLARDMLGNTAWQLAIRNGRIMVIEKILNLTKGMQLNPDKLRHILLLDQEGDGRTAWFLAVKSGNVKILEELWILAKEKGNPVEIKSKFLLAQNENGETALHVAASGSVTVLEKLWVFVKETQLKRDELKNKLLLARDKYGYTAWLRAAERGNSDALDLLWKWSKEAGLNTYELKNNLLLAQNKEGETACHFAAEAKDDIILQKLWIWTNELYVNSEKFDDKLLLGKDKSGNTAWHRAIKRGSSETLQTLWNWATKMKINPHELFLAQNKEGQNSWILAAQRGNLEILQKLWVWARLYSKEMKETMLLSKDGIGYTALHQAAERGGLEAIDTLCSWTREVELNIDTFLLAETADGYTAFHLAAHNNHAETLEKLWVLAEEPQHNNKDFKKRIFLAKEKKGHLPWHRAAVGGRLEALAILWNWGMEVGLNRDELLLAVTQDGYTAFHLAAHNNHVETLKNLWVWAEGTQWNQTDFRNKVFLAKDICGFIAWHRAAAGGSLEALDTLWNWAEAAGLIKDKLLLAHSTEGYNAFHVAADYNQVQTLMKLWEWAGEMQHKQKEMKKQLFLSQDMYSNIAWHWATDGGSLEALETLWGWATEAEINTDELLLAQNGNGYTAFHLAAKENFVETLNKLWVWAEETQHNQQGFKKKLFLATGKKGQIAWHRAAVAGSLEALEMLWNWATETGISRDELLLAKTADEYTAFHLAAQNNHVKTQSKLWVWAEKLKTHQNELNKIYFDTMTGMHTSRGTGWQ